MRERSLKLSQILEVMPGWCSTMRTATGPQKGRLIIVLLFLPHWPQVPDAFPLPTKLLPDNGVHGRMMAATIA